MKFIVFLGVSLFLAGCTVGPFVADIRAAGPNRLEVRKCDMGYEALFGAHWITDCSTETIQLPPPTNPQDSPSPK